MAPLKQKGDLAEMMVAADLIGRGHKVAFPHGEDWDFDLILFREGRFERVQVKYTESNGTIICVRCRSHSLTGGRIRSTKHYTSAMIEWLAIYDRTTNKCYYVPASELGDGRSTMHLRLRPTRNFQRRGIRFADAYLRPELDGARTEPSADYA